MRARARDMCSPVELATPHLPVRSHFNPCANPETAVCHKHARASSPFPYSARPRPPSARLLDVVLVCEEHGEAIDAHAPASRGRQPVLEGRAEGLVHKHRLIVAGGLVLRARRGPRSGSSAYRQGAGCEAHGRLPTPAVNTRAGSRHSNSTANCQLPAHRRLLCKELALARWVVELGVGVADLLAVDKQLKALGHARQGAVPAHGQAGRQANRRTPRQ